MIFVPFSDRVAMAESEGLAEDFASKSIQNLLVAGKACLKGNSMQEGSGLGLQYEYPL